jgi:hypothetical protein
LRNRIYDFVAEDLSLQERRNIYHQHNKNCQPHFTRNWGFMGFTQTNRLIRQELRPICMSRLALKVDHPDLLAFTDTFFTDILSNPHSAPKSVIFNLLDEGCPLKHVIGFDIAPLLRIMSDCSTSHDLYFTSSQRFIKRDGELAEILNKAVGPYAEDWATALLDVHQFKLYLPAHLPVRIMMKASMKTLVPWMDDWTVWGRHHSHGIDGARVFLRRMGIVKLEDLQRIQVLRGEDVVERRATRRQIQSLGVLLDDYFVDLFST